MEKINEQVGNTIDFPISIKFGENREFNFRAWRGHERRLLKEHIDKDTLGDNKISDILVYGCMESPVYLNDQEVLYVIHKLRVESFNTPINIPFECDCGHSQVISSMEVGEIRDKNIRDISLEGKQFHMKDINISLDDFSSIRDNNSMERIYAEMIYHVEYFIVNDTKYESFNITDIDSYFDKNLSIAEFDSAIQQFENMSFKFNPTIDIVCTECLESTTIVVDYLEDIFN